MGLWWALVVAAAAAIVFYVLRREWPMSRGRRVTVTLLLALGVIGPLLIALNPVWIEPVAPPPGKPVVTVLVDGTMSMGVEDAEPDASISRLSRAIELAQQVRSKNGQVEVRQQILGDSLVDRPTGSDALNDWPQGHRTDLAAALRRTTRSGSSQQHAVLLISDGAHNVGSVQGVVAAAQEAKSLATPVYAVTLGTEVGLQNISLSARSPRMIAFPDNPLAIRVRVAHRGLAGQETQLTLYRGDRAVSTETVRLEDAPDQEVRFVLEEGAERPMEQFRIIASEVAGEATAADNQTTVLVQRLDEPVDVLLLEGKPYWDSKFLARNLSADPVVQLTSIIRLGEQRFLQKRLPRSGDLEHGGDAPPDQPEAAASTEGDAAQLTAAREDADASEKSDSTAAPAWKIQKELDSPLENPELLERYRLVILGRDADSYLTPRAVDNLRQWISRSGGCLLCARGAPSNQVVRKLAEILPVRWSASEEARFRTRVTEYGVDAAVFDPLLSGGADPLATLPSLATGAVPKAREGLPQVLIQSVVDRSGKTIPVVTYQPYGAGQTIVVEGSGMWRWAFLPPQHANKDKIYPALWQSMIQWVVSQQDLMPGQQVAIRSDRASFFAGDRATASILVEDPSAVRNDRGALDLAVLLQPVDGGLPKRVTPAASGLEEDYFRVDFGELDVGYYTASVVRGEADEVLAETAIEVRDPWFENLEVDARPDLMRRVARTSGGELLAPNEVAGLVERHRERLEETRVDKTIRTTLWDRPWVLSLILGGWVVTWIVRRRSGLI